MTAPERAEEIAPMVPVTVMLPAAYVEALDDLAWVRGESRSHEVRYAVKCHLAKYPRHAEVARG